MWEWPPLSGGSAKEACRHHTKVIFVTHVLNSSHGTPNHHFGVSCYVVSILSKLVCLSVCSNLPILLCSQLLHNNSTFGHSLSYFKIHPFRGMQKDHSWVKIEVFPMVKQAVQHWPFFIRFFGPGQLVNATKIEF